MDVTSTPSQLSKLCTKCKVLEVEVESLLKASPPDSSATEWEVDLGWELHDQWSSWSDITQCRELANADCDMCKIVYSTMNSWPMQKDILDLSWLARRDDFDIRLSMCYVLCRESNGGYRLQSLRMKVHADELDYPPVQVDYSIGTTEPLQTSALALASPPTHIDPDRIHWMRSNIHSCLLHYHKRAQDGFVPDRLIKVDQDTLSLVLTKDALDAEFHPPPGRTDLPLYAALTYCWGPPPYSERQLKTTEGNLLQHQKEIPLDKLPQTIKDAVAVTRALSIPYLWVDALCILQDVGSDWDYQCKQMEKIYGNAYITIGALSANHCEEGFVNRTDKITIQYFSQDASTQGKFSIYCPSYRKLSSDEIPDSFWMTRGWTFQERLASTRLMLFGRSNIHFRCLEGISSMSKYNGEFQFELLDRRILHEGDRDQVYRHWYKDIAAAFTHYHYDFTRANDILPSVAGFAAAFEDKLQDRYVAGLWEADLHCGLGWRRNGSSDVTYRALLDELESPSQYIAPSWSWASRDQEVSFTAPRKNSDNRVRYECTILDAVTYLEGTSHFGALTGGYLEISARVYTGSRRLVRPPESGPDPEFEQAVQLDDQYLLTLSADCRIQDLFKRNDDRDELCAPVSFLVIGSIGRPPDLRTQSPGERRRRRRIERRTSCLGWVCEGEGQEGLSEDYNPTDMGNDDFCLSDGDSGSSWSGSTWSGLAESPSSGGDVKESTRDGSDEETDDASDRLAYGLLIHSTGNPEEFYRIGNFRSECRGLGGLSFFDRCETRTIRLV